MHYMLLKITSLLHGSKTSGQELPTEPVQEKKFRTFTTEKKEE